MHEASAPLVIQRDLDQIDAPRGSACEGVGRAPQAPERLGAEAHAWPETRTAASGLDLDHDQDLALREHEIDLGPACSQAPREEAPAAGPERAFDQAFPRAREPGITGRERAQREPWGKAREQRARAADQALLGSTFSSSAASFSASITLWIAEREKRRRTLSATCSTATSAVVVTTVP